MQHSGDAIGAFATVPPRRSFSLDATGSGLAVVFGGCARDKSVIYGDVWVGRAPVGANTPEWHYAVGRDAPTPPARYGHASCAVPEDAPAKEIAGCIVIHGGRGQNGALLADMWAFDPRTETWTQLAGKAADVTLAPPPRCYHTLTYCGAAGLALYGGATDKSPRGTKHVWLWRDGKWTALRVDRASAQKRFKHTCWYHPAKNLLLLYGALASASAAAAEVSWKLLKWSKETARPAGSQAVRAIASESCVVVDPNTLVVLGSAYALLVHLSFSAVRVVARCDALPAWWKGTSPGIQGAHWGRGDEREVTFWNLYPKTVSDALAVHIDGQALSVSALPLPHAPLADAPLAPLCHRPPLAPVPADAVSAQHCDGLYLSDDGRRWLSWNGEARSFFALPVTASPAPSKGGGFSTQGDDDEVALVSYASVKESDDDDSSVSGMSGGGGGGDDDDDANDGAEEMPLLLEVQEHRVRTPLKRIHALLMSWEKRGADPDAHAAHKRVSRKDELRDADQEIFGIADAKSDFDWRHFAFTLLRGALFCVFAVAYFFSRRFSFAVKMAFVALGLLNVGVIALPVATYTWPPGQSLQSEVALVWAPFIFYFVLLLVHSTIEGSWRDTGGTSASLTWLDRFQCTVVDEKQRRRMWRGGDFVSTLIEYEGAMRDPWEYVMLAFILAPVIGLVKAGLFILVDFLVVSSVIPIDANPLVHVVFAVAMLLNLVTAFVLLSLLAICAYVYRRQLRLLRLVTACTSKRDSARLSIPHLSLRNVVNVRFWSAMRTFAMSRKAHLPVTSANAIVGFGLLFTAVLWIILIISVFVDRTRAAILTPLNISVAFFAVVLFYYVAVCIRQFVLLNNNLRSHAGLLAREAIRLQLAGEGKSSARKLLRQLDELLRLESSSFRILGVDIPQASLNVMLGLFLPLSVATLTNVLLDLASNPGGGPLANVTCACPSK